MAKVSSLTIKQQTGTDRTFFATWKFSNQYLDKFTVKWYYATGDGVWFEASSSDITIRQSVYSSVPENAKKIKITVKPVSKKYKKGNKELYHWTGVSVKKEFNLVNALHVTPSKPEVRIERYRETPDVVESNKNQYKLVVECNDIDPVTKSLNYIEFYVHKDGSYKPTYSSGLIDYNETVGHKKWVQTVPVGSNYRVRSKFFLKNSKKTGGDYSPWSDTVSTPPETPTFNDNDTSRLNKITGDTAEVFIYFTHSSATEFTIEYTYDKRYFDSNSSEVQTWNSSQGVQGWSHAVITDIDLKKGNTWFFRVKASNDAGDSYWSDPISLVLGKKPGVPTTWSSVTSAIVGEDVNLYWIHNAEDCSTQTSAQVEITINGVKNTYTVTNPYVNDDDNKDKTLSYTLKTAGLEDADITWRVRTAGALANQYGDWSIVRSITVHAEPTLSISLTDSEGIDIGGVVTTLPFYIKAVPGPPTQSPTGYHVTIVADEEYKDVDNVGNEITIAKGQAVYSKYFDIKFDLVLPITATNINLRGGIQYTISCVVSMDSGLSKEVVKTFEVDWVDETYFLDASIDIDDERGYVASIRPYCRVLQEVNENLVEGELADDVLLSVYRREYDGTFTEIESYIENDGSVVVDRHPSLDYARYRIIATSKTTGAISYEDVNTIVDCDSVIIQWEEENGSTVFADDPDITDALEANPYPGSLLMIPYNIDITDSNNLDVSLVEYIGREHPVSYYGTQKGTSATWNVEIPKEDTDTLYDIRRLAIYTGDVYVREPSGVGYWANVKVSYSKKHKDVVIPVTFSITRVEGGA